jgi:hypothetical protein
VVAQYRVLTVAKRPQMVFLVLASGAPVVLRVDDNDKRKGPMR